MNRTKLKLRLIYQLLFTLATIVLLAICIFTLQNIELSKWHSYWVDHTHQVASKSSHLLYNLIEAESGVRGYNLSGAEEYLSSYRYDIDTVSVLLEDLKKLTIDNPSQQQRIQLLESEIAARKTIFEKNMTIFKESKTDQMTTNYKKLIGKSITDHIRGLVAKINQEEDNLLASRKKQLSASFERTKWLVICTIILFPCFALYAFLLVNRYLTEKESYENQLFNANIKLKSALSELDFTNQELAASNEELQSANEELAATSEEIQSAHESVILANQHLEELNDTLEQKIEERIQELKERNDALQRINNDLDDFVYTAAHDLKSPANTLEGLVEILTFQIGTNASPDVNKTLSLMTDSTTRLKRTIHELTQILRVQKEEGLQRDIIRFDVLFEEVKDEIKNLIFQIMPEIITDWQVEEIQYPQKHLRSILYNLLSNAVKYHSPQRKAVIRISSYCLYDTTHTRQVFLKVEDNGLGMDSGHLTQLFTMFKRFHDHVEGSGLGLYTIKRMIENNGGSIWVESEEGVGTCFVILLYSVPDSIA
jgi:signal transduction histidine kinase/CHASE3 domain sensor protein